MHYLAFDGPDLCELWGNCFRHSRAKDQCGSRPQTHLSEAMSYASMRGIGAGCVLRPLFFRVCSELRHVWGKLFQSRETETAKVVSLSEVVR